MSQPIVNAAPMVIGLGTEDVSTVTLPRVPLALPQHLPRIFLYAQKGPTDGQIAVGSERDRMYGTDTFDYRGPYANHQTVFANGINAEGNACVYTRMVPADAGPKSNFTLYIDVLATTVDLYQRNSDGSIATNSLGDPIVSGTAPGFKYKFVTTTKTTDLSLDAGFGNATIVAGDQVDPVTGTVSQRYPIMDSVVTSKGKWGDGVGFRVWSPTSKTEPMPTQLMDKARAYPYRFAIVNRKDELSTPIIQRTLFDEATVSFTFKDGAIDPLTDRDVAFDKNFVSSYRNLKDVRYPKVYGDIEKIHLYKQNLETLLTMFHGAEIPFINSTSDFTSSAADKHLFNFIGGVSSSGVPYHTYVAVDAPDAVQLTEFTQIMHKSGSDGTMNDALFDGLVSTYMDRYLDPNDELMELAIHPESCVYDSGFGLPTKLKLINMIAVRQDTYVFLSTHTNGQRELSASEEYSLAIALRTRARMYPESVTFGTSVMRAVILGRSSELRASQWTSKLPMLYELAIKNAKYMGASTGRWKKGSDYDGAPGSIVDYMTEPNIKHVPATVRNRNWDVGLNFVLPYDLNAYFFPAFKTVYDDDTSVLNSVPTMMAIGYLNKIAHACWREITGSSNLSQTELVKKANDFVNARVDGIFDDRFKIVPKTFYTEMDALRGYSFTMPIEIYANNMITVMTTYVRAFRAA